MIIYDKIREEKKLVAYDYNLDKLFKLYIKATLQAGILFGELARMGGYPW
jgi:hypothetical protein